MAVDEARLNNFLGQFVTDLGATASAAMVASNLLFEVRP